LLINRKKEDKLRFLKEQIYFLSNWVGQEPAEAVSWKEKLSLMRQIRIKSLSPVGLRATNLTSTKEINLRDIYFSFEYKRQFIDFKIPSKYLTNFSAPSQDSGTFLNPIFTKNGQSALSLVITSLYKIYGDEVEIQSGGLYFETKDIYDSLRIKVKSKSMAKQKIFHWDSTVRWDNEQNLEEFSSVIIDTTYLINEEIPFEQLKLIMQKKPVFFVRSHLKLDSLGAEYGLWGSLWCSIPQDFLLKEKFFNEILNNTRLWGINADFEDVYPFITDQDFYKINHARNLRLKEVGKYWEEKIIHPSVSHFPHNLFFTINIYQVESVDLIEKKFKLLVKMIELQGVECLAVDSFGFDFIACKVFSRRETLTSTLRITCGDLTVEEADIVVREVNEWLKKI
jgi:hypothetical protein